MRATQLTCIQPEFAALWQEVMHEPWTPESGPTEVGERQRLRDELDAIVAHVYGLSRDDFAHILGTFPLVFPDTPDGAKRKAEVLRQYEKFSGLV